MSSTLCITGATGFLGSHCVAHALENGFTVHATTRSESSAEFLKLLATGKEDKLKIFPNCDLLKEGSFDKAIEGCEIVLHTASPFFMANAKENGEEKLVKPAREGTKNVLEACERLGVKKVVLTSSTAAIYVSYGTKAPDHVYSEKDWTSEELMIEKSNYYSLSKTVAEKLAWEIEGKSNFKLAVMNPCLIVGDMLKGQSRLNTSHFLILKMFSGKDQKYVQNCMHLVDVYDVARAHIKAAMASSDSEIWGKRFLLVGSSNITKEVLETIKDSKVIPDDMKQKVPSEPNLELPPAVMGAPPPHETKFDTTRSTELLGLGSFIGLEEMLDKTVKTLQEHGFNDISQYTP